MIAVPVLLPCLKQCKASCNTMELWSQLLTIDMQTFQMVSIKPIPLYPPLTFGIRTMVVKIKASGIYPSRNATYTTLTTLSHILVIVSFSLVADCNHALRCSTFIPDGNPAMPNWSFCTAAAISPPFGGPSTILTGCTRIGSGSPSGGRRL